MKTVIGSMISRYGRYALCWDREGRVLGGGRMLLQPITREQWQKSADALGAYRTDRFLGIAPADFPALEPGEGSWLECGGQGYTPIAAQAVYLGEEQTHWWMVLEPREEAL